MAGKARHQENVSPSLACPILRMNPAGVSEGTTKCRTFSRLPLRTPASPTASSMPRVHQRGDREPVVTPAFSPWLKYPSSHHRTVAEALDHQHVAALVAARPDD